MQITQVSIPDRYAKNLETANCPVSGEMFQFLIGTLKTRQSTEGDGAKGEVSIPDRYAKNNFIINIIGLFVLCFNS